MKYCVNMLRESIKLFSDVFGITAFIPVITCIFFRLMFWLSFYEGQYWIIITWFSILLIIRILTLIYSWEEQNR